MKLSNDIKVGLTVLLASIVLYSGFRFMRDLPILQADLVFYATFPQIEGLATGRPVYINGVDVGKVQFVRLLPNDSVEIRMNIDRKHTITAGSVARLRSIDILGSKAIDIKKGTSPTTLPDGSHIPGETEKDMMSDLMKNGLGLSGDLGSTLAKLNKILSGLDETLNGQGGKTHVLQTLKQIDGFTRQLDGTIRSKRGDIERSIQLLEKTLSETHQLTSENRAGITTTVGNLEKASAQMDSLLQQTMEVSKELTVVLQRINRGEGTLGKLATDPALYQNLDSTLFQINGLVQEFRTNPKKYLKYLKPSLF